MNRKVLSALMAGTMLVSATACSGAKAASESVRAHNNPQTQASVDGVAAIDVSVNVTQLQ